MMRSPRKLCLLGVVRSLQNLQNSPANRKFSHYIVPPENVPFFVPKDTHHKIQASLPFMMCTFKTTEMLRISQVTQYNKNFKSLRI